MRQLNVLRETIVQTRARVTQVTRVQIQIQIDITFAIFREKL